MLLSAVRRECRRDVSHCREHQNTRASSAPRDSKSHSQESSGNPRGKWESVWESVEYFDLARLNGDAVALRARVEAAVLAEVARVGVPAFNRATVVRPFLVEGGKQATLYRWIDQILASGSPEQHLARVVEMAAADRVAKEASPGAGVAAEVRSKLPATVKIEHIATAGVVPVIDRLNTCLAASEQLMAHARNDEGKVRNARLLLAASEHLRRCIDTAARITDTLMRADKIERYHSALIEEIAAESPSTAERILLRISRLTAAWGNG